MALSPAEAKRTVERLRNDARPEWARLGRFVRYVRGQQRLPWLPDNAETEYRDIAKKSASNWLELVVRATAQGLHVDGYGSEAGESSLWDEVWQPNGMDARQHALHRAALTLGYSYVVAFPSADDEGEPDGGVWMRPEAATNLFAVYDDPSDEWPTLALRQVRKGTKDGKGGLYELYDAEARYTIADGKVAVAAHDLGFAPVVKIEAQLDLLGTPQGEIEAVIPIQDRIVGGFVALQLSASRRSTVRFCMAYMPILKAKPGEFMAWRNAEPAVIAAARPVFEVAPTHGEDRDVADVANQVAHAWPGGPATIDLGALDQLAPIGGTGARLVEWLAGELDGQVPYRPVVRVDDPPEVLADVAAAAARHREGVCLRLGSEENDPDPATADAALPTILGGTGLGVNDIDLLVDLWAVASEREVAGALPVAMDALTWAAATGPWRSVTVASGAFPASISNLPRPGNTAIPRLDAELFDQVMAAGPGVAPDFGDYAINHPALPTTAARGPLPNLRYAFERDWQVYREPKDLPGHQSFFTLCDKVRSGPHWAGAGFSWGDREVDRCADANGGPGRATEWRAYGTSHHLALVTDRLATLGEP